MLSLLNWRLDPAGGSFPVFVFTSLTFREIPIIQAKMWCSSSVTRDTLADVCIIWLHRWQCLITRDDLNKQPCRFDSLGSLLFTNMEAWEIGFERSTLTSSTLCALLIIADLHHHLEWQILKSVNNGLFHSLFMFHYLCASIIVTVYSEVWNVPPHFPYREEEKLGSLSNINKDGNKWYLKSFFELNRNEHDHCSVG